LYWQLQERQRAASGKIKNPEKAVPAAAETVEVVQGAGRKIDPQSPGERSDPGITPSEWHAGDKTEKTDTGYCVRAGVYLL
jgi:hypothetical protein